MRVGLLCRYTLAINEPLAENLHVLYSNRSAAHAGAKQFKEALADAERCVAADPCWAKGYYRLGAAREGLLRFEDAHAAYAKGAALEPADPLLNKAIVDLAGMMEELRLTQTQVAAAANPEDDRFRVMLDWLLAGHCVFPKLFLQYYSEDYRGVHAAARIPADEVVLEVPLSHIMTSEVAKASDIGAKLVAAEAAGMELRSKHTFLACYMITEKPKKEQSFWWPYLGACHSIRPGLAFFFSVFSCRASLFLRLLVLGWLVNFLFVHSRPPQPRCPNGTETCPSSSTPTSWLGCTAPCVWTK